MTFGNGDNNRIMNLKKNGDITVLLSKSYDFN